MSWQARWKSLPRRTRLWITGGGLAALAVLVTLGIAATRGDEKEEPRGQARPADMAGMQGMEGMEGMDMSTDGSVRLTVGQIQEFGITFGFAEQRTLTNEVRTVGSVVFDETRMAQVAPKFSGFVERLYVDFTGKPVRRGQPLLEIYSPDRTWTRPSSMGRWSAYGPR